jgi:hypothetical protein
VTLYQIEWRMCLPYCHILIHTTYLQRIPFLRISHRLKDISRHFANYRQYLAWREKRMTTLNTKMKAAAAPHSQRRTSYNYKKFRTKQLVSCPRFERATYHIPARCVNAPAQSDTSSYSKADLLVDRALCTCCSKNSRKYK